MTEQLEAMREAQRCHTMIADALRNGCTDDALDAAVARVHGLPDCVPHRGWLAAGLVTVVMKGVRHGVPRLRHLDGLLALAAMDPPPDPQWPRLRIGARLYVIHYELFQQNGVSDPDAVLAELDAIAAEAGDDPGIASLIDLTRTPVVLARAVANGQHSTIDRMPAELAKLDQLAARHPELAPFAEFAGQAMDATRANQRGDTVELSRAIEAMQKSAARLPTDHPMSGAMNEALGPIAQLQDIMGRLSAGEPTTAATAPRTNSVPVTGPVSAASRLVAGAAVLGGGQETDPDQIRATIESFRQLVAETRADDPQLPFYLLSVAMALHRLTQVTGSPAGLDEAVRLLKRARGLLKGPHDPQWSLVLELQSIVQQRLGQHTEAGRTGLDGLRSSVWRALMQSDLTGAKIAIRDAAASAVDVARRCLFENDVAGVMEALDTARGLLLFVTTERRNLTAVLEHVGEPELARRWERACGTEVNADAQDGLRNDVLTAVSRHTGALSGLFDPPDLGEIRAALGQLDADALVYLVSGEGAHPGMAVVAPREGPPSYLALPGLMIAPDLEIDRYLVALAGRSRDMVSKSGGRAGFAGRVSALCDWAWRAAVGPLLERCLPALPARPDGRVPRLVLIPMGDLARVPWQAARRGDGTYAIELAAFSFAVSARMLCDNAWRSPVPPTSTGLVVGDPDAGDTVETLHAARREAFAIRQAFYRGARYVGRRPDGSVSSSGAGTSEQIRNWLADPDPTAGTVLHLACHGSFTSGEDARSCLLLAGWPGNGELGAAELVEVLDTPGRRDLGLVVLAACNTGRSVHGYDEAYSLGTAFLAGGARSVLSTQWSIPDVATSSLMFMFHHYVRHEGLPPWEALRQAQLWMLSGDRQPPHRMPAELRPRPSGPDPAEVVAWAGFVHWGH